MTPTIVLFLIGSILSDGTPADTIKDRLLEHGFQNVSVVLGDGQVIVTCENRMYRHEVRAIREVVAILLPIAKEGVNIAIILQSRKIPLVAINISPEEESRCNVDVSIDVNPFWEKIRDVERINSSSWKFDVIVHPQLKADFGIEVDAQVNLAPELDVTLWKGMSLSAQLIIPLYNELGEAGNHWRPGLLTMGQVLRLPGNIFAAATTGYFTLNRYGADMEIRKYLANGRCFMGANLGYTGYASYRKGTWYYSDIDAPTALLSMGYRLPQFDLSLVATYGKFLYQDRGWRFDVLQQFGEIGLGLHAAVTDSGKNVGSNSAYRSSHPDTPG